MDVCKDLDITDYKSAFECFKQRFLIEKKSIFRLDVNTDILNNDSIKYLVDNFIENGYSGKASFIQKIEHQLITAPKEKNEENTILSNAIEVLAHIVWLWRLVPSNVKMSSTIKSVKEVFDLDGELKKIILKDNPFFNEEIKGIAEAGTFYNTNKPFEIAFVIKFLKYFIKYETEKTEVTILNEIGDISIITTGDLDINDKFETKNEEKSKPKTTSILNALLYLFEPNNYEAIVSNTHKQKIVNAFSNLVSDDCTPIYKPELDWKIKCIKDKLDDSNKSINFFYKEDIRELWDPSILLAKNVIYYGPSGTGKTYTIQNAVNQKVLLENAKVLFTQFYPSFGYEDFIEGLKPHIVEGATELKLTDGIFKKFCKEAIEELKYARMNNIEPQAYYFVADEINRAELSTVFGELLLCIEDSKRIDFDINGKIKNSSVLISTQYSYLYQNENDAVFIDDNGEYKFGVPSNLYFIGTMNTADRSISQMDKALRRRFEFTEMMSNPLLLHADLESVIESKEDWEDIRNWDMNNKHEFWSFDKDYSEDIMIEGVNLRRMLYKINQRIECLYDRDYTIGHAYFMGLWDSKKLNINELSNIFKNKIIPLLQECFYDDWEKIRLVLADNQKSEEYQFIKLKKAYDVIDLFGKNLDDYDLNEEKKVYEINIDAFQKPESYKEIYETK